METTIPPEEVVYYTEGLGSGSKSNDDPVRTGDYKTIEHALLGLRVTIESKFYRACITHKATEARIIHMYRDPGSSIYYVRIDYPNLEGVIALGPLA